MFKLYCRICVGSVNNRGYPNSYNETGGDFWLLVNEKHLIKYIFELWEQTIVKAQTVVCWSINIEIKIINYLHSWEWWKSYVGNILRFCIKQMYISSLYVPFYTHFVEALGNKTIWFKEPMLKHFKLVQVAFKLHQIYQTCFDQKT